jgi:Reverse transcriptase (RNA-dependent DNA polymerase)
VIILRYADDIVVGFEHDADARRLWEAMRSRFEQFSLALHPDKTRLLDLAAMLRRIVCGTLPGQFLSFSAFAGQSNTSVEPA